MCTCTHTHTHSQKYQATPEVDMHWYTDIISVKKEFISATEMTDIQFLELNIREMPVKTNSRVQITEMSSLDFVQNGLNLNY